MKRSSGKRLDKGKRRSIMGSVKEIPMEVKIVKTVNGDDLVTKIKQGETTSVLKNPCILIATGQSSLGLAPWAFMTKDGMQGGDGIEIKNEHILFVAEAQEEIYNQYNEQFGSGLVVPTKKEVAAPDLKLTT
tara:strand:+ start:4575 stop:4970 length:396 start_codon:yes stop_codon:yes gene_type:complete